MHIHIGGSQKSILGNWANHCQGPTTALVLVKSDSLLCAGVVAVVRLGRSSLQLVQSGQFSPCSLLQYRA